MIVLVGRTGIFRHLQSSSSGLLRLVHTTSSRCSRSRPWKDTQTPTVNQPLYTVPDLAVELDAEDNPHVRVYDADVGAEQRREWRKVLASVDELQQRLADFEDDAAEAASRMEATAAVPNRWRVLDSDIWAAALADVTDSKEPDMRLQQLLYHNGITPRIATDPATVVDLLFHRRALAKSRDASTDDDQDGPAAAGSSKFARTREAVVGDLATCDGVDDVERLLTLTVQTHWGCIIVGQLSPRIAIRLAEHLADSPQHISMLLLNLRLAFAAKSVAFRPPFYRLGMRAATLSGEPVAMRQFLETGLSSKAVEEQEERVEPWLLRVLRDLRAALKTSVVFDGRRAELFTLLTGQPQGALDGEMSLREAVLDRKTTRTRGPFLLGPATAPVREAYFGVLAELGCVRTLWEEKQLDSTQPGRAQDLLVRAALRYGEYSSADARPVGNDAVSSTQLDLAMLDDYEKSTAGATSSPRGAASSAFREAVVDSFAQETRDGMLDAVGRVLQFGMDTE